MADPFDKSTSLTGPATGGEAADLASTDHVFANTTRAIFVGTAGTVTVVFKDGSEVDHVCAAGTILPVRATAIRKATTDASDIVGWW